MGLFFQMAEVRTWSSFDTEYSACSVEVKGDLIATGTYQVVKVNDEGDKEEEESPETKRLGRVYLHRVKRDEDEKLSVDEVCRRETQAVLDMKWAPGRDRILAVADAGGQLTVYRTGSDEEIELILEGVCKTTPGLALSLDWAANGELVVVSDSKGEVVVVRMAEGGMEEEGIYKVLPNHSADLPV